MSRLAYLFTVSLLLTPFPLSAQVYFRMESFVKDSLIGMREYVSMDPFQTLLAYDPSFSADTTDPSPEIGAPLAETILNSFDIDGFHDDRLLDTVEMGTRTRLAKQHQSIRSCPCDTIAIKRADSLHLIIFSSVACEWRIVSAYRRIYLYDERYHGFHGTAVFPVKFYACRPLQNRIVETMLRTVRRRFGADTVVLYRRTE